MNYHNNAKTNQKQRQAIQQESNKSYRELSAQYCVSQTTIGKWKKSDQTRDHSSRPYRIHYALSKDEERIIVKVRDQGFLLDDLLETLSPYIERLNRSNCYRTLLKYKRNRLDTETKRQQKKFAQYQPGFLHIDAFYLPRLGPKGKKKRYYCFLAIDRATRSILLEVYPDKTARSAGDFLAKCLQHFPFFIRYVLTDNGREFVVSGVKNRYGTIKTKNLFQTICGIAGIDHRKTKVKHPWTNGLAERLVRTVKDNTIKLNRYRTIDDALQDIKSFQDYHNNQRRLKMLGGTTPLEKIIEYYQEKPELFLKEPNQGSSTTS
jgi:transposase InsO family protein